MRLKYKIKCQFCGKWHQATTKTARFCSPYCSGKYNMGVTFKKLPSKKYKHCAKCDRILLKASFSRDINRQDGLQSFCKFCTSMWTRRRASSLSYKEMLTILIKQNWECAICGESMKDCFDNPALLGDNKTKHFKSISIDHINPRSKVKRNNIQLVHQICNISKSNRDMKELIQWCTKVIKRHEKK